jgi:GntR family transcriptional regulator/MocR family aminotransferase
MMWSRFIKLDPSSGKSLQLQIRRAIVAAIGEGFLPVGTRLPSSRDLAAELDVARNTVVLAFQQLVDEGILESHERSGHYVAERSKAPEPPVLAPGGQRIDWNARLTHWPSRVRNIVKPRDWQRLPYPFIHGQPDPALFPINDWRECVRSASSTLEIRDWSRDLIDGDDPMLVEELRKHVLPLRGVFAATEDIMITLGAQQALYLLAALLMDASTVVGIEEPGYPDARNIFAARSAVIELLPVDEGGLPVEERFDRCDYAYVTPSHQCPTTVTMPMARREALIERARREDVVLIEDDYEIETPVGRTPLPAIKSLDREGRVLYVGSLSKTLAPGLRLGYVVAPAPIIAELRALRRLMLRHPPANNQRAAALFISLGHYEAHLKRIARVMREREAVMDEALARHLPGLIRTRDVGATSVWLEAKGIDVAHLAQRALARGVVIETGDVFFGAPSPPMGFLRLGFSTIPTARIERGVMELAKALAEG